VTDSYAWDISVIRVILDCIEFEFSVNTKCFLCKMFESQVNLRQFIFSGYSNKSLTLSYISYISAQPHTISLSQCLITKGLAVIQTV